MEYVENCLFKNKILVEKFNNHITKIKPILLTGILLLFLFPLLNAQKQNVTLEDLFSNRTFRPKSVQGLQTMKDGQNYTTVSNNAIVKYSYKTGFAVDTLVKVSDFKNKKIDNLSNYVFSTDEKRILFYTNRDGIYRHSFVADYFVWDIGEQKLYPVSEDGNERLATLSPDGKKVAFIKNNNLFISDLSGKVTAITTDGKENKIINGAPDWVYEEEFGYNKAFEWSPIGDKIAWCRFDENHVKEFNIQRFKGLNPELKENELYPEDYRFKYPKAGEDNSILSVHIYNLKNQERITVNIGEETDIYIPRIYWTKKENTLAVVRLNRLQNKMELLYADDKKGTSEVVYIDENKYYIDEPAYSNIQFIDSDRFMTISESDGYRHIYIYNTKTKEKQQVSKGNFDVIRFVDYDPKNKLVYYISSEEGAIYQTVYSIHESGNKKVKLSNNLGINNIAFSEGFNYYISYYSSSKKPLYITLNDCKGKLIRVLEDNNELIEKVSNYNISQKEFFTFTTIENVELNGWMMKPVDFDENKKYPVVMVQYSGPNSQQVRDSWKIGWEDVLVSENFVVVCVDGRGTGGRGEAFRKCTYLQLGKYETLDQIETAKYLQTLPFVQPDKIGIWGWSYGGFMALNSILQGSDYFAAAIAVAPVTNWRYYDNIYTERFMRTPQENPDGYDINSPISHVEKLKGKLLIIHGTFDDNVHAQNTYEFVEALVQADKQFDMMLYTNRNHSIYGGNTTMHLYRKKIEFFIQSLKR